jgi:hypothetical protein
MSKLTDTLKKALEKKQGTHHVDNSDTPVVAKKTSRPQTSVMGKKPPTKSAGRGR